MSSLLTSEAIEKLRAIEGITVEVFTNGEVIRTFDQVYRSLSQQPVDWEHWVDEQLKFYE